MKMQILIGVGVVAGMTALYGQNPVEFKGTAFQFSGVGGGEGKVFGGESLGSRIVTGKPFSATEERHSVQILGDGTRIQSSETNRLYRDDQGRTRIEPSSGNITIFDPVAGFSVELDPVNKAASKMNVVVREGRIVAKTNLGLAISAEVTDVTRLAKLQAELAQLQSQYTPTYPSVVQLKKQIAELQAAQDRGISVQVLPADRIKVATAANQEAKVNAEHSVTFTAAGVGPVTVRVGAGDNASVESLAAQMVNGALAQGTRTTETIPAGKIGNDRPINIVNERWFSNDLQMLVKSTSSDPRFGDTTYQLNGIVQSSPDPSLFQIPADYTIRK
jgi:hypothetical protein